jgi:hypothetical protein
VPRDQVSQVRGGAIAIADGLAKRVHVAVDGAAAVVDLHIKVEHGIALARDGGAELVDG